MKYLIDYKSTINNRLDLLLSKLPFNVRTSLNSFISSNRITDINEIRLKKDSFIGLIADSKNLVTDIFINDEKIKEIFSSLCNDSIYSHFNTIIDGYINVGNGIRAGICGKAIIENNSVIAIDNISSINIRIPNDIENSSKYLFNLLKNTGFQKSILIYSAPGVGKTTILRDLIKKLEDYEKIIRYAVIDTKEEITSGIDKTISGDVFLAYPKGIAIELATKSMTPQYILCDEISSYSEAESILRAVNSGVNLIATTHARDIKDLFSKEIIKPLLSSNIFDYALGVFRDYGKRQFKFELTELSKWSL